MDVKQKKQYFIDSAYCTVYHKKPAAGPGRRLPFNPLI